MPFFSLAICLALALVAATASSPSARAQAKSDPAKTLASAKADPEAQTPLDTLRLYTFDLIDGMTEKQLQSVYVIRTRHGLIRAVEVVRRDVGKAVGLCAKAHPDMKKPLEARFTRWKDTVNPILEDAQSVLSRDIAKEAFVKKDKILKLLDLTVEAGDYADSRVVKEIVTTPEACDFLLKNMDLTQKDLPDLLRASLKELKLPDPTPTAMPPDAPPQSPAPSPKSP